MNFGLQITVTHRTGQKVIMHNVDFSESTMPYDGSVRRTLPFRFMSLAHNQIATFQVPLVKAVAVEAEITQCPNFYEK